MFSQKGSWILERITNEELVGILKWILFVCVQLDSFIVVLVSLLKLIRLLPNKVKWYITHNRKGGDIMPQIEIWTENVIIIKEYVFQIIYSFMNFYT